MAQQSVEFFFKDLLMIFFILCFYVKCLPKQGYGFIIRDDTQSDVFIHHTGITGEGFKSLEEDQKVEFNVFQGSKGDQAKDCKSISFTGTTPKKVEKV